MTAERSSIYGVDAAGDVSSLFGNALGELGESSIKEFALSVSIFTDSDILDFAMIIMLFNQEIIVRIFVKIRSPTQFSQTRFQLRLATLAARILNNEFNSRRFERLRLIDQKSDDLRLR